MAFTHLHVHSHYSLLTGLPQVKDLVQAAKDQNMSALALTDSGVMYGIIEFYQACKKAEIKPIIGCELYIAPHGRKSKRARIDEEHHQIVLIARNNTGYQSLIDLVTKSHIEGYFHKPRIDDELLKEHHEGLICLTGSLNGEIPSALIRGDEKRAKEVLEKYIKLFGKEFVFLEVQPHTNTPHQLEVNEAIFSLSKETGVKVVATNDVHYIKPEDAEAHDVLLCLGTKAKRDDQDRFSMLGEDYSFRSEQEMRALFSAHPECIENTQVIADLCEVDIELNQNLLPHFDVPEGHDYNSFLKESCLKGYIQRFDLETNILFENKTEEVFWKEVKEQPLNELIPIFEKAGDTQAQKRLERLDYEFSIIGKTGFSSYFLIVADFVKWAKEQDIVVGPGRGSAAGSFVSYLMEITNIDPIEYDLLFERFLNPDRISMPDIDLDFADTRRDEVLQYVREMYGEDHVCHIITFGTMAARAAVRDTGRVMGLPYMYCDEMSKLIPMGYSLEKAVEEIPELKTKYQVDPQAQQLIDMAKRLEGAAKHTSMHACGVVISKDPLNTYMPYQYAMVDEHSIVSQYSLHPIEDIGLLKMDFLGLTNLTLIEYTIKLIKEHEGIDIDMDAIPLDDEKTYQLFCQGQTTGIFQFESSGMKRYLKQLKPSNIEHLIAMVALYRPGPMEWIPQFVAGKHGQKPTYLHPKLQPILDTTYGVAVYQEQVMRISRDLAGFTPGEADVLRKAMGKKIPELLAEQKEKFMNGCVENGIEKELANDVFAFIEPFAGYGFNRSHAACYAIIAYQTAYLKANYPEEFMCALLSCDKGDGDRVAIEVEECRILGIPVLPPHVNRSEENFTVVYGKDTKGKEKKAIQFAFGAIKNFGEHIAEVITKERKENGKYEGLEDLLSRVQDKDMNKKSLEALIKSGALDAFGKRGVLFANLERILDYHKNITHEKVSNQVNLFGAINGADEKPTLQLQEFEPASNKQILMWEKEFLNVYLSNHPLKEYLPLLRGVTTPIGMLWQVSKGANVKIAGIVVSMKKIITKSQETMLFVKLEDISSSVETLIFPKKYVELQDIFKDDAIVAVSGKISDKEDDDELKILVEDASEITLENAKDKARNLKEFQQFRKKEKNVFVPPTTVSSANGLSSAIYIQVSELIKAQANSLKQILEACPGQYRVFLVMNKLGVSKKIETPYLIDYTPQVQARIEEITGENTIRLG